MLLNLLCFLFFMIGIKPFYTLTLLKKTNKVVAQLSYLPVNHLITIIAFPLHIPLPIHNIYENQPNTYLYLHNITHFHNISNIITSTSINTIKFILFCDVVGIFFHYFNGHIFCGGHSGV